MERRKFIKSSIVGVGAAAGGVALGQAAAPTLASALNLVAPRLSPEDAPLTLPAPITDGLITRALDLLRAPAVDAGAPLSISQRVQLTLAHACDSQILDPTSALDARRRYLGIRSKSDAADYIKEVEERIRTRRKPAPVAHS